jgi:hypothetical protein
VKVPRPGKYRVGLVLLRHPDGGRVRVALAGRNIFKDGRRCAEGHTPHLRILRRAEGDRAIDLAAGEHALTLQAVDEGGRPAARPVGVDFLWLKPQ